MKKARMNISHSRFILSKLKIFGEIVTTLLLTIISISIVDFEWREKDTLTSQYGSSLKLKSEATLRCTVQE